MMAFDFLGFPEGRSAIVTGAASGIGAATAQMLCAAGLTVIGVDIDADRLHGLDPGPAFHPHVFDTGKPDEVARHMADRKSVVEGKSVSVRVDLGGGRIIKKKKKK